MPANQFKRYFIYLLTFLIIGFVMIKFIGSNELENIDEGAYVDKNADIGKLYIEAQNCRRITPINKKQASICLKSFKTLKDNIAKDYPLYDKILKASVNSIHRIEYEINDDLNKVTSEENVLKMRYAQIMLKNAEDLYWDQIEADVANAENGVPVIEKEGSEVFYGGITGLIITFFLFYLILIVFNGNFKKSKYAQLLKTFGLNEYSSLIEKDLQQVKKVQFVLPMLFLKRRQKYFSVNENEVEEKKLKMEEKAMLTRIYSNMWKIEFAFILKSELVHIKQKKEARIQNLKISKIIQDFRDKVLN